MKEAIGDALRSFAHSTTPEELAKKGVRRVRSVSMSQFTNMIHVAIERALEERGAQLEPELQNTVIRGAREQLHRMLAAREDLETRRARVADLRAELDEAADSAAAVRSGESQGDESERVAVLERRIAKLAAALEETEASLEAALSSFDNGLRSGVRRSDGVEEDDPKRDQKLDMMKGIFEQNEDLDHE